MLPPSPSLVARHRLTGASSGRSSQQRGWEAACNARRTTWSWPLSALALSDTARQTSSAGSTMQRGTLMNQAFEWFRNSEGHLTTSLGVPYNELFSTQEIRRLTFTRLQVSKSQDLPLFAAERQAGSSLADPFIDSWLGLATALVWGPPLLLTAFLTGYRRRPDSPDGQSERQADSPPRAARGRDSP